MSSALRLASASDERLAPAMPGSAGRRSSSRRAAARVLGLLVLAALAVMVATGRIGVPGTGSATSMRTKRGAARGAARDAPPARAQGPLRAAPRASEASPAPDRVVGPTHAAALFAQHTWFVLKPAPPPPEPPPPPPPEPTAPSFPYTFVGSFAPRGEKPVYFLARGDRVIDARVGDRLDGVYQFESAASGQLVFVYLPLNVRQNLSAGGSK